jgi:hypothetical protein
MTIIKKTNNKCRRNGEEGEKEELSHTVEGMQISAATMEIQRFLKKKRRTAI